MPSSKSDGQLKKPIDRQGSSNEGRKRLLARRRNRGEGSTRRNLLRRGLLRQLWRKQNAFVERSRLPRRMWLARLPNRLGKPERNGRWWRGSSRKASSLWSCPLPREKDRCKDGVFHFAVPGAVGSGKSSLINALCGMSNQDPNAAPTGIVETTLEGGRYSNPKHSDQFAWYDVPGSGTLKIPDWQYFNSQGLYVFDCVIVLFNNRFTMTDQAILTNCRRFQIPTFIIRSKADQHIRNLMQEIGYDSDGGAETKEGIYKVAREQFITETRRSVEENLLEVQVPDQ